MRAKRRAQFMRGVGEQHAMRVDQVLDAAGGGVETRREAGDLVAAFDLHARRQRSGAERFDAGLQALQPARQPAHDRIGAERDHQRDRAEEENQPDQRIAERAAARAPRSSVRPEAAGSSADRRDRAASRRARTAAAAAGQTPRSGANWNRTMRDRSAACAPGARSSSCCAAAPSSGGGRMAAASSPATSKPGVHGGSCVPKPPHRSRDRHDHDQGADDGQIDFLIQALHLILSLSMTFPKTGSHFSGSCANLAPWRTHNRRRAR